jgi:integrase
MAAKQLETQADVFRLPLPTGGRSEIAYFDRGKPKDRAKGLALRVRKDGSRVWTFFYRFHGKQKKLVIGAASDDLAGWTITKARTTAHALRVAVNQGSDPAEARSRAEGEARASRTFKETVDAFLAARERSMKPRSHAGVKRYLENHWSPFHRRAIHEIDADMVADRLSEIEKANGFMTRNRARSALSSMFTWATKERFAKQLKQPWVNPVLGTSKVEENDSRDRTLSDDELAAIWKAAPESGYGRIVKLLMLTGQRREEIGSLRWSEINEAEAQIELPATRTKNRRPHIVPLSELALQVLQGQPQDADRDLVFGEGANGYSGWSRSKAALDKACGVKNWTLHDLRRTAATGMAGLGVQPHIIEAILNHISGHKGGVAGIYNRAQYADEKREALDRWANHIRIAVARAEGANVTTLARA